MNRRGFLRSLACIIGGGGLAAKYAAMSSPAEGEAATDPGTVGQFVYDDGAWREWTINSSSENVFVEVDGHLYDAIPYTIYRKTRLKPIEVVNT